MTDTHLDVLDLEHVAEIDQSAAAYLGDRSKLSAVSREELAQRLRDGDVVVLDVRPAPEYRAGMSPAPFRCPSTNCRGACATCRRTAVVANRRGPYCVYADDAVRTLRRRGYQGARLEDGDPEWARAGLPVERARAEQISAGYMNGRAWAARLSAVVRRSPVRRAALARSRYLSPRTRRPPATGRLIVRPARVAVLYRGVARILRPCTRRVATPSGGSPRPGVGRGPCAVGWGAAAAGVAAG